MNSSAQELTEHFFRNEYGKLVAVISRQLGYEHVELAEDVVQDTLLKAVQHWEMNGIPENPQAWLYTTAKNRLLNVLRKKRVRLKHDNTLGNSDEASIFSTELYVIDDDMLRMMFVCCSQDIPENSQLALVLKTLCGFSLSEIANAFLTTTETINKRLVRGRKILREQNIDFDFSSDINKSIETVLKAIYLLFNEGYKTTEGENLIRHDLCLEAIRLAKVIERNKNVANKSNCYALTALMYFDISRFDARVDEEGCIIEMKNQERGKWNKEFINQGVYYLSKSTEKNAVSIYHILATISGIHCTAPTYEDTDWKTILNLYDQYLLLDHSFLVKMNRTIALANVNGVTTAINELEKLEIERNHTFYAILGDFYLQYSDNKKASKYLSKAITLTQNIIEKKSLEKKLHGIVPD